MTASTIIDSTAVVLPDKPTEQQAARVEAFLDALRRSQDDQIDGVAKLTTPDGSEVEVPAVMFDLIRQLASALAKGQAVTVGTAARELTTTEAARLLGMSRPTLTKLLDSDQLPSHKVNTHRRVYLDDLLDFRRQRLLRQRNAYEAMMLESDALGIDE